MKITVLFYNFGGYHLARLASAKSVFDSAGYQLVAIEITGSTTGHPWGEFTRPEYVRTLSKIASGDSPTVGEAGLLIDALDEFNPDVIAVPGWGFDFSRITISWGRRNNKHLILMSESKRDDSPRNFLKEAVKKYFWVSKFHAGLVGGQKHVEYLAELGMQRSSIFTGYDVVDNEFFINEVRQAQASWSAAGGRSETFPSRKFFLSANRFIPRKNLPGLIESFAAAVVSGKMYDDWDLVLLGGGTDEQTQVIQSSIVKSGLEGRVHCPGFVTYDKISHWYAAASAFVHPALSEQWGLVVNEAMAAGLPILVSDTCGCHPELVDEGVNGFGFDPNSTTDMTSKIIKMTNSDLESFGQASSNKIALEFSASCFGVGMLNAINTLKHK